MPVVVAVTVVVVVVVIVWVVVVVKVMGTSTVEVMETVIVGVVVLGISDILKGKSREGLGLRDVGLCDARCGRDGDGFRCGWRGGFGGCTLRFYTCTDAADEGARLLLNAAEYG